MSVVYLTRRAVFSASHRLHSPGMTDEENLRLFGKCNNPSSHGHNYVIEVTLRGRVDPRSGVLINLTDLKKAIQERILDVMDHKNLNQDVEAFRDINPTAENIAIVCWRLLEDSLPPGALYEVLLRETENNFVSYRGE